MLSDVPPNASVAVDPSPLQQRTDDDASVRAASVTTPLAESSLSAQEAYDFFVEGDACEVLARGAKDKERCTHAAALAELIVTWGDDRAATLTLADCNLEPVLLRLQRIRH